MTSCLRDDDDDDDDSRSLVKNVVVFFYFCHAHRSFGPQLALSVRPVYDSKDPKQYSTDCFKTRVPTVYAHRYVSRRFTKRLLQPVCTVISSSGDSDENKLIARRSVLSVTRRT